MERWRPILGVEQIIVSVISMLSDPNDDSPANIDAAVSYLCLNIIMFVWILTLDFYSFLLVGDVEK